MNKKIDGESHNPFGLGFLALPKLTRSTRSYHRQDILSALGNAEGAGRGFGEEGHRGQVLKILGVNGARTVHPATTTTSSSTNSSSSSTPDTNQRPRSCPSLCTAIQAAIGREPCL